MLVNAHQDVKLTNVAGATLAASSAARRRFRVFVYGNHFAAYMTMCAMAALATMHRGARTLPPPPRWRPSLRRDLLALGEREGLGLIVAAIPVLFAVAVATTSRGGILSFVGALGIASVAIVGADSVSRPSSRRWPRATRCAPTSRRSSSSPGATSRTPWPCAGRWRRRPSSTAATRWAEETGLQWAQ